MSTTTGIVTKDVVVPNSPLPEGAKVIVIALKKPTRQFDSALEFLESLPPGSHAFTTWEECERFLREECNSWDR